MQGGNARIGLAMGGGVLGRWPVALSGRVSSRTDRSFELTEQLRTIKCGFGGLQQIDRLRDLSRLKINSSERWQNGAFAAGDRRTRFCR